MSHEQDAEQWERTVAMIHLEGIPARIQKMKEETGKLVEVFENLPADALLEMRVGQLNLTIKEMVDDATKATTELMQSLSALSAIIDASRAVPEEPDREGEGN